MNKSIKIVTLLALSSLVLTSCKNKDNEYIDTKDVTFVFRPHEQSYSDDNGYLNSYFFFLIETDIEKQYTGTISNVIPNFKVNVLKTYNDLNEDIKYLFATLPFNYRYGGSYYGDKKNYYYSGMRTFYIRYLDYLSQFNQFLCFVGVGYKYSGMDYTYYEYLPDSQGTRKIETYLKSNQYSFSMSHLRFIPVKDDKLMLNSLIEFEHQWMDRERDVNGENEYKSPGVERYELLFEDGVDVRTEFPTKLEDYYSNYNKYVKQISKK